MFLRGAVFHRLGRRDRHGPRHTYTAHRYAVLDKRDHIVEEGKALRLTTIDVTRIRENQRAKEYVEEEVKQQRIKVRIAEKNLDAARLKMQAAMQERKIHEKMREKAFERFVEEQNAEEVKEIDQLTSYVYGTKEDDED